MGGSVSPSIVLLIPAAGTGSNFMGTSPTAPAATDFPARKGDWQLGHVCDLPMAPSGIVNLWRQAGHVMLANMDWHSVMAADPIRRGFKSASLRILKRGSGACNWIPRKKSGEPHRQ